VETFVRIGALRRWFSRPDVASGLKKCYTVFNRFYGNSAAYMQAMNVEADDDDDADDDEVIATLSNKDDIARVRHEGVVYSRSRTHHGNSQILFYPNGDRRHPPLPALIDKISRSEGEITLTVRCYRERHSQIDPFERFQHFDAKLYSSQVANSTLEVKLPWIKCHFAAYEWTKKDTAILSLSRVSNMNMIVH